MGIYHSINCSRDVRRINKRALAGRTRGKMGRGVRMKIWGGVVWSEIFMDEACICWLAGWLCGASNCFRQAVSSAPACLPAAAVCQTGRNCKMTRDHVCYWWKYIAMEARDRDAKQYSNKKNSNPLLGVYILGTFSYLQIMSCCLIY